MIHLITVILNRFTIHESILHIVKFTKFSELPIHDASRKVDLESRIDSKNHES